MKDQKEFFNEKAEIWDEICHHDMDKVREILDMIHIPLDAKILDVGTGTGVLIPELVKCISEKGQIIAVDVADKMVEKAKTKHTYPNVSFKCMDALMIEDKDYDVITCYSMFPHFDDKEKAIYSLADKLLKNGKLAICHSQSREAINQLHGAADDRVKEDRLPRKEIIEAYMKQAGLSLVQAVDTEDMFVLIGEK